MLHNWIVRRWKGHNTTPSEWWCSHCHAQAYGPNTPIEHGCSGKPPRQHRPDEATMRMDT